MNKVFGKILIAIAVVAALVGAIFGLNHLENYEEYFYVQVDNSKLSEAHSSEEMRYQYQLPGYNSEGQQKSIAFKTTRELRDRAYLKVLLKATGVNRWEEVQPDDIPAKTRTQLNK